MGLTSAAKCPDFSTFLVGREGLEPPTPCASCRCSSRFALDVSPRLTSAN